MTNQYEEWQLLHWLKDFAEEIGHTPTQIELESEPSMPNVSTYRAHFKNYNNAVRAAGLEINSKNYKHEKVLKKLEKACDNKGRGLSFQEIKENEELPSTSYFYYRYGGIQQVLKKIGYNQKLERPRYTSDEILAKLKKLAKKIGRTPTQKEVKNEEELPSLTTYCKHFESYAAACKKAGLVPYKPGRQLKFLDDEELEKRLVK